MSGFLAGKVWQSDLAPSLKPLAAALADIANDDGTSIYPSVEYVAWLLGKGERSVQRGLAELRRMAVLEVVAYPSGGRGCATEYRLIEERLPKRVPWRQYRMKKKGAILAPFIEGVKGDGRDTKGEVSQSQRVQFSTRKGVGSCTPPVKEAPSNPPSHPPQPNDAGISGEVMAAATEGKPTDQECRNLFERFWSLYPKPYSKHRTWAEWRSLKPTPGMLEAIIEDFTTRQKFPDWRRENGRFIPLSENYLKSRVWLDWDHPRAVPPPKIERYLASLRAVPQGAVTAVSAG
jgi:hypothetical protein